MARVHGINRCWTRQPCEVAALAHQVVRKVRDMADSSTYVPYMGRAEPSQARHAPDLGQNSIHRRIRGPIEIRELLHEWKLHLSPQRTSTGM